MDTWLDIKVIDSFAPLIELISLVTWGHVVFAFIWIVGLAFCWLELAPVIFRCQKCGGSSAWPRDPKCEDCNDSGNC